MNKNNFQSIKDGDYHKFCEDLKSVSHLNFKCYGDYDYELKETPLPPQIINLMMKEKLICL